MQKSTVTAIISKLSKRDYLYKVQSKDDLRVLHIRLAEKGKRLIDYENLGYQHFAQAITKNLNDDEKTQFAVLLNKMGNKMKVTDVDTAEKVEGFNQEEVDILHLATRAPSGHNTQPWTIKRIQPYNWVIGTDTSRWLPAVDPDNREMLLSIGAFLECLVLAAGAWGYDTTVDIIAKERRDHAIAEVKLIKSKETNEISCPG